MAEIYGIVSGVLGLFPLCHVGFVTEVSPDGLGVLIDVFDTPKTFQLPVGRLELQRDKFDEWREIWTSECGDVDMKFEAYAKSNPVSAKKVLRQLALLAQVLFDATGLEEYYGIKSERANRDSKDLSQFRLKSGQELNIETTGIFLERCRLNLNFFQRTHFTLFKKDTLFHTLIAHLKEHISVLITYGPSPSLSKLRKGELELVKELNLHELRRLAEAASYESKHEDGDEKARYRDLSLAAQFSSVVKFERPHAAFKFSMRDFRMDETYILPSNLSSTMALLFDYPVKKENRVVLIEWLPPSPSLQDTERETRIKTLMLATPKPGQLLLPTCYGMLEDPYSRRFGLVLAPPPHIRSGLPSILTAGAISKKRMPASLREVMSRRHPACVGILELGTRFGLARRVVGSVWGMGCVGPSSGGHSGLSTTLSHPLDYAEPLFTGLFSPQLDILQEPSAIYDYHGGGEQLTLASHAPPIHVDHQVQLIHPLPHYDQAPSYDISINYYLHPHKASNPRHPHSRGYDIYSLGVLLLEIGLWKNLDSVVDLRLLFEEEEEYENGAFERIRQEFLGLCGRLDGLTGSIYANVVRKCLSINARDRTEEERRELSGFWRETMVILDKCCA
ncbi:hypothetical protein HYALB_00010781 [Hymenoscyphus albidus]|uniref:Uncharacterized protein n=1 Tax=Hymenoscyphus albidus TaxID=595503 RepID=A0A9N9LQQ5_9HELO|nr:hypothetical protein HYALB_00010781 [Hymenoscyphus albidus]